MSRFVLLFDASTSGAALAPQLTAEWLSGAAAALTVYLDRDVTSYWGGSADVRVGANVTDATVGEIPVAMLDVVPNDPPGAVAFHDAAGGQPYAVLDLSTCRTLDDVSEALGHELGEAHVDPDCNEWIDDGQGSEWAKEISDAVEGGNYRIDGFLMPDFVLPPFFFVGGAGPYRYTASIGAGPDCAGPFITAPGGYQARRPVGGGVVQVDGEIHPARVDRHRRWTSRSYRRGLRI